MKCSNLRNTTTDLDAVATIVGLYTKRIPIWGNGKILYDRGIKRL